MPHLTELPVPDYVLTPMPKPIAVRWEAGTAVHFTDDREKTLCGLKGAVIDDPGPVTCRKCVATAESKARTYRILHPR